MQSLIPFADILIHSGDFVTHCDWPPNVNGTDLQRTITMKKIKDPNELKKIGIPDSIIEFNEWIGTLPHRYKIVIGGNHEAVFNDLSADFIQE